MEFAWEIPRTIAGLLMLSTAMWVISLDPRSRLMQAFSAFMLLRGLVNILLPFAGERYAGGEVPALLAINGYYQIAVPFAAIVFALLLIYPDHRARRPVIATILIGASLEVWYFFDHAAFLGGEFRGWMDQVLGLQGLAYLAVAHAMLIDRDAPVARFTAGVAYMLFPIFAGAFGVAEFIDAWLNNRIFAPTPQRWSNFWFRLATLVYGVAIAAWICRGTPAQRRNIMLAATTAAVAGGIVPVVWGRIIGMDEYTLSLPLNGLFTAALPVAVAWALTRDEFYTPFRPVRWRSWVLSAAFGIGWLMIIIALYAAIRGAGAVAAVVGTVALSVVLFLLIQTASMGRNGHA